MNRKKENSISSLESKPENCRSLHLLEESRNVCTYTLRLFRKTSTYCGLVLFGSTYFRQFRRTNSSHDLVVHHLATIIISILVRYRHCSPLMFNFYFSSYFSQVTIWWFQCPGKILHSASGGVGPLSRLYMDYGSYNIRIKLLTQPLLPPSRWSRKRLRLRPEPIERTQ